MPRKVDIVQPGILAHLKHMRDKLHIPISYAVTSSLGGGFVDLVVGYGCEPGEGTGITYMFEIKNDAKSLFTPAEIKFRGGWCGHYSPATCIEDILEELGL